MKKYRERRPWSARGLAVSGQRALSGLDLGSRPASEANETEAQLSCRNHLSDIIRLSINV